MDIHGYPPSDLLKLLAHILTHIAATNDKIEDSHLYSNPSPSSSNPPVWHSLTTAARSALTNPSSTLTFHARNVPTISLEAYFLRILKYCPTSNSVFLSLLVYFDRMSKLSLKVLNRPFIIDSFNIHRLVIAGVTVASKFFSDVFYTNSRYAKVGGLPLGELNQLELQFLLLNDFRLYVSTTDMQDYAEQLVLFARAEPIPSAPNLALPDFPPLNGHGHTRSSNHNGNSTHRSSPSPTSSPSPEPQLRHVSTHSSLATSHNTNRSISISHTHPYPPSLSPSSSPPPPDTDPETDEDCDASTETDAETTVSSTSTDTDDEPTIRGPRTVVVGGDGDTSP